MSFLNPGVLFFLPLAALPLIIHLIGRRRYQIINFSSLRFLKNMQNDVIRRLRLRQILLLLLRTLLIFLLIFSFARPYRAAKAPGLFIRKGTTVYFVIDNSASMNLVAQGRSLLELGTAMLLTTTAETEFPVIVKILTASSPRQFLFQAPVSDMNQLRKALATVPRSEMAGDLTAALHTVIGTIKAEREFNAVVWMVSDWQKSNWKSAKFSLEPTYLSAFHEYHLRLFLMPVWVEATNFAVSDLHLSGALPEPNAPVAITTQIANWGSRSRECGVSLFVEQERAGQTLINLPATSKKQVQFEFIPLTTGKLSAYVQIGDDDNHGDNRRYCIVTVPEQVRIAVVGRTANDTRYLFKALSAGFAESAKAEYLPLGTLGTVDLTKYDLLIFSNVDELPSGAQASLTSYIERGKGILLWLGPDCREETYNRYWAEKYGFPRWHGLRTAGGSAYLKIGRYDTEHQLFNTLWLPEAKPGSSPHFFTIPGILTGRNQKVLMAFDDGTPFIVEANRALLFATGLHESWSDLPLTGFFPAILSRAARYLANLSLEKTEYEAGDSLRFERLVGAPDSRVWVETPSGKRFYPEYRSRTTDYIFTQTTETGVYNVYQGGRTIRRFAVNVPTGECESEWFTSEDLKTLIKQSPQQIAVLTASRDGNLEQMTLSHEFSLYLLILALITALAETFIGRINREQNLSQ